MLIFLEKFVLPSWTPNNCCWKVFSGVLSEVSLPTFVSGTVLCPPDGVKERQGLTTLKNNVYETYENFYEIINEKNRIKQITKLTKIK